MKLGVIAIGKPGRGPEAVLAADYAERATLAGPALRLGPLELIDLEPRKPGKVPEAELILKAAEGAHLIACDERGKTFSSRAFADHIAGLRDRGERRAGVGVRHRRRRRTGRQRARRGRIDPRLRPADLAARPGAGHAGGTAVSRRDHPGRIALP